MLLFRKLWDSRGMDENTHAGDIVEISMRGVVRGKNVSCWKKDEIRGTLAVFSLTSVQPP